METTAPLSRYFRLALNNPNAKFFENGDTEPMLHKDRTNHVLFYRGSFNPPHQGHKDALCHAFFRAGNNLNIVAAVVVFTSDVHIAGKLAERNPGRAPLVFKKADRIRLWNSSGLHGNWHCCWGFEQDYLGAFRATVAKLASKDGYNIETVYILGGDYVFDAATPLWERRVICCGARGDERTPLEETPVGLQQLAGFDKWTLSPPDRDLMNRLITEGNLDFLQQKVAMLFPKVHEKLPTYDSPLYQAWSEDRKTQKKTRFTKAWFLNALRRTGQNRICTSTDGKGRWVLFIPYDFIGMTGGENFPNTYPPKSSSALIEGIWAAKTQEQVREALVKGHAVSHELAFEILKPWMARRALPETEEQVAGQEEDDAREQSDEE